MLAGTQMRNLSSDFAASTAANITWQIFGNGVIVGPRRTPGEHHSKPCSLFECDTSRTLP